MLYFKGGNVSYFWSLTIKLTVRCTICFICKQIVETPVDRSGPGVGISKGRKCYDLVNASYLWLVDRTYDAFTSLQHLRPFEIQAPGLIII